MKYELIILYYIILYYIIYIYIYIMVISKWYIDAFQYRNCGYKGIEYEYWAVGHAQGRQETRG